MRVKSMYIIHLVCGVSVVGVVVVRGVCRVCGARDVCCVVYGEVVVLKPPMMEHRFAENMFRFGARCGVIQGHGRI